MIDFLDTVKRVDQAHPELLRTNTGATCFQFCEIVIALLRAKGYAAAHVSKSPGESQYVPPGFAARTITGRDGKVYSCSGVSHDAIYVDGQQVDIIGGSNDSETPHAPATPQWGVIPAAHYRPNNVAISLTLPPPAPAPTPVPERKAYPGDAAFDLIGQVLANDYSNVGRELDGQVGRWYGRVIYDWLSGECDTLDASVRKHRAEWLAALGSR